MSRRTCIPGAVHIIERSLLSERTRNGLAAARPRGRTGGQKPKLGPRQVAPAREMYERLGPNGRRRPTVEQIAAEFAVTSSKTSPVCR